METADKLPKHITAVAVFFLLLVPIEIFWAIYNAAHPLNPYNSFNIVVTIVLWASGGLAMALISGSGESLHGTRWKNSVWTVATISVLANFAVSMIYFGRPGFLILYRDLVAIVVLIIVLTWTVALVARRLDHSKTGPWSRFLLLTIVSLVLTIPVFILGLIVHCTSGDCL
jgi:hypothetical protein